MSKYDLLLRSSPCLWSTEAEGLCSEPFNSVSALTQHLRIQHLGWVGRSGEVGANDSWRCQWKGCGQLVVGSSEDFLVHVLCHPHHCFLKLLGSELQVKMSLPACQYNFNMSEVVRPLEVEPRCLWEGGACLKTFDDVWEFYGHVREHVKKSSDFKCSWSDCKFSGRDRNKVLEHVRTHSGEKMVACPTCGVRFCNNTKLKDHLNRQVAPSGDPDMICRYCRKSFPNERLLREHSRKHINNVRCPHCGLTCQSPSRLHQHVRSRHVDRKSHQCPLCHRTYKTVQSLSLHIETHGEYRVTCPYPKCKFLAKSEKLLKAHERDVHFSEEDAKFCCHICSARYPLGRMLSVHLKKVHRFELPPGHCRFRYVESEDGFKRLQTVRLDDENVYTPELNTFTTSCSEENIFSNACSSDNSEDNLKGHLQPSSSFPDLGSARNSAPVAALLGSNKSPPSSLSQPSTSAGSGFAAALEYGSVEATDSFSSIMPPSDYSGYQVEGVTPTSSYDAVVAHLSAIESQDARVWGGQHHSTQGHLDLDTHKSYTQFHHRYSQQSPL